LISNPTRIRSPALVFAAKGTDNEVPPPEEFAALCTNAAVGEPTVSVNAAVPVPALLVAFSVTLEVPKEVGVPEIDPVAVLTERPAGSPVALKLVGDLVAVILYEKALPTAPLAVVALVIAGGVAPKAADERQRRPAKARADLSR
jgi:hypothetical protein